MTLGENIRSIRKIRKMNLLYVNKITGLSKSTLSETKETLLNSSIDTLILITKAHNVEVMLEKCKIGMWAGSLSIKLTQELKGLELKESDDVNITVEIDKIIIEKTK